jgi:hypothetical protein
MPPGVTRAATSEAGSPDREATNDRLGFRSSVDMSFPRGSPLSQWDTSAVRFMVARRGSGVPVCSSSI